MSNYRGFGQCEQCGASLGQGDDQYCIDCTMEYQGLVSHRQRAFLDMQANMQRVMRADAGMGTSMGMLPNTFAPLPLPPMPCGQQQFDFGARQQSNNFGNDFAGRLPAHQSGYGHEPVRPSQPAWQHGRDGPRSQPPPRRADNYRFDGYDGRNQGGYRGRSGSRHGPAPKTPGKYDMPAKSRADQTPPPPGYRCKKCLGLGKPEYDAAMHHYRYCGFLTSDERRKAMEEHERLKVPHRRDRLKQYRRDREKRVAEWMKLNPGKKVPEEFANGVEEGEEEEADEEEEERGESQCKEQKKGEDAAQDSQRAIAVPEASPMQEGQPKDRAEWKFQRAPQHKQSEASAYVQRKVEEVSARFSTATPLMVAKQVRAELSAMAWEEVVSGNGPMLSDDVWRVLNQYTAKLKRGC